jgi:hypothetical protein
MALRLINLIFLKVHSYRADDGHESLHIWIYCNIRVDELKLITCKCNTLGIDRIHTRCSCTIRDVLPCVQRYVAYSAKIDGYEVHTRRSSDGGGSMTQHVQKI